MYTLRSYIADIAQPTFDELYADRGSSRRLFLAAVAIYHAIERAPGYTKGMRQRWANESLEFRLVDTLAHHLKHVESDAERIPPGTRPGLPVARLFGFGRPGDEGLDVRNLYFVVRDALEFVKAKADELEPDP